MLPWLAIVATWIRLVGAQTSAERASIVVGMRQPNLAAFSSSTFGQSSLLGLTGYPRASTALTNWPSSASSSYQDPRSAYSTLYAPASTATPLSSWGTCEDASTQCASLVTQGACDYSRNSMDMYCQRSCGFCFSASSALSPFKSPTVSRPVDVLVGSRPAPQTTTLPQYQRSTELYAAYAPAVSDLKERCVDSLSTRWGRGCGDYGVKRGCSKTVGGDGCYCDNPTYGTAFRTDCPYSCDACEKPRVGIDVLGKVGEGCNTVTKCADNLRCVSSLGLESTLGSCQPINPFGSA